MVAFLAMCSSQRPQEQGGCSQSFTPDLSPLSPNRLSPLSTSIQKAGGCEKVQTAQGHGRYFLRLALQEKVLAAAVRELAQTPRLLEVQHTVGS